MRRTRQPMKTLPVTARTIASSPPEADGPCRRGGEGGIRTPDTVARMPHFECGAFNHSATSPRHAARFGLAALYLAAARRRNKVDRGGWGPASANCGIFAPSRRLKLAADQPVERVGPAAAQRNGEEDQAPEEDEFPTVPAPGVAIGQELDADHRHFDGDRGGKQACEQAENDANGAEGFVEEGKDGEEHGGFVPQLRHLLGGA